ncbi:MAG TPA: CDP-glycerol glycerophosphotransferase family protein [Pyrinomonadaceae bacterium]|nr:CDP-glycerol glycerophosphotransferase family protein [Pyrinomonadaceae bacterium]
MTEPGKKTLALVVSSGWSVRTFLQTEVLPRLQAKVRLIILASPSLVPPLKELMDPQIAIEPLQPFDHNRGAYGGIYSRRNYYFRSLGRTQSRSAKLRRYRRTLNGRKGALLRSYLLEAEARLLASQTTIRSLFKRELEAFYRDYAHLDFYHDIFERYQPDLILSTVPHVSIEAPPILVGRRLGIKTACWINSWDNLTTKSAYFADYDHYFVWSERMRSELMRYYGKPAALPITATGVPHFDWYRSPSMQLSRAEFCKLMGLDPSHPIILYAMATPHLAPAEEVVVKRLAEDLHGGAFKNEPQLIIRLHPADDGARLRDHQFEGSVKVQMPGKAGSGDIFQYYPSVAENREFVNSIRHADVVINLASTITLDASVCDRPVITVAFDPSPDGRYQPAIDDFHYKYDHYGTVLQHNAVRVARTHEELLAHIGTYLEHPELERQGRAGLAELWCGPLDGRSAERLATALIDAVPAKERSRPAIAT